MKTILIVLLLLCIGAAFFIFRSTPDRSSTFPLNRKDIDSSASSKGFKPAMQMDTSISVDHSVEAELASFKIEDGYQVELYASESLGIAKPSAMRWDEKGRLWVLCIPDYPHPLPGKKPNGRLVILEDRDSDGKADTSKYFSDGLNIPLGFELGHGGVYLGEQTRLLFLQDSNDDDREDVRQVKLSGFGAYDSHQTINSFTWSPAGELFFSQGLSIYSRIETPWGVKKANRGAIWRYRPHTGELDNFFDESTASDNPWGMNFGEWGEMFSKSNDTGVYFINPGLVVNAQKALIPEIGATHIKSGSLEILRSRHLPDSLWGNFLVAGYYNSQVERFKVFTKGSGFSARLMKPLLVSSSQSFRPVDIKVGPDGAIYVLDWYNPVIGHYQASMRDPMRDKTHGRVWRIAAKGRPRMEYPVLDRQPIRVLLDHLKSEEHWVRYQVRRLLAARSTKDIDAAVPDWVEKLNPTSPGYEHHLMEAICVYESHHLVNIALLNKLLSARDPGARSYAAQVVGRWVHQLKDPLSLLRPLINDPVPRVRLMALVAASSIQRPEAMVLAAEALNHPMDKFLNYALEKTANALVAFWGPALQQQQISFEKQEHLAWIVSVVTPSWYAAQHYRDLLRGELINRDVKRKLFLGLARDGKEGDFELIINYAAKHRDSKLIEELSKLDKKPISTNSIDQLHSMLTSYSADSLSIAGLQLASAWQIRSLQSPIERIVYNKKSTDKLRAKAINTLAVLKGRQALPQLKLLLQDPKTPFLSKIAALQSISVLDMKTATALLVKEISYLATDVNRLGSIMYPIFEHSDGSKELVRQLQKSVIAPKDAEMMLSVVYRDGVKDSMLAIILKKYADAGKQDIPREYDAAYIKDLADQVNRQGETGKGQLVYDSKTNCVSCHIIGNKGGRTGPDLSAVGSGLLMNDIITEVLWPDKNIKEGYNSIQIRTRQGESIQGVKAFETPESITIKSTTNPPVSVLKKNIVKRTEIGSLMPAGLANSLSKKELIDLLKYLSEQRN